MTTFAGNGNALVIEHSGGKSGSSMTHAAIFGGGDMSGKFAGGCGTIVAGTAVAGDTHMIKDRRAERRGVMTKLTVLIGW